MEHTTNPARDIPGARIVCFNQFEENPMKFHDFTIVDGGVHSERLQDTTALEPTAIDVTRGMLKKLREGQRFVRPPIAIVPEFNVMLGLPDEMAGFHSTAEDAAQARNLFFCVADVAAPLPFQYNLVLPGGTRSTEQQELEQRALVTLLVLSQAPLGKHPAPGELIGVVEQLWAKRPLLATTVLPWVPNAPAGQDLVMVAADFSTCFATAMGFGNVHERGRTRT